MNAADRFFYIMGWILIGSFALLCILQNRGILTLTEIGFPCSFHAVTGLYCPGCGGTRAVCSLARGDFLASVRQHFFVLYTGAGFLLYNGWNTVITLLNKRKDTDSTHFPIMHFRTVYVYIGIAIIFLQWLLKNILLLCCGIVF
jgi:hypothetical protein